MKEMSSAYLPERNPITAQKHRREVLLQITLPLIIAVLAMLALCVLTVIGSPPSVSRWADISLIWLILPSLAGVLILAIVLGAIAFGIVFLIRKLPVWMFQLQDLLGSLGGAVRRLDDKLVEPFLKVHSFGASLDALRGALSGKRRR